MKTERYIVTKEGCMKGFWRIVDTDKDSTVVTCQSKRFAQDTANDWNSRGRWLCNIMTGKLEID